MIIMDTEELLRAISHDAPCGEDLEYDAAFLEIERSSQPLARDGLVGRTEAGEEPDWRVVAQQAKALLSRTKDLRILVLSLKAAIHIGGVAGFGNAVAGLRAVLAQYWEGVHPRLVIDGEDNSVQRINILRELCDREGVLAPLRALPLVTLPALGAFSLRDIAIASGEVVAAPASPSSSKPPDLASIDAAFANCPLPELQATLDSLRHLSSDLEAIQTFVNSRSTVEHALSLEPLTDLITRMLSAVTARSSRRIAAVGTPAAQSPSGAGAAGRHLGGEHAAASLPVAVSPGTVASREDVVRTLDRICDYYERQEPSSPVPMLLQRAKRLVFMSFVDIVRELAPAGMSEVETIRGPEETPSR
jgi:type VI secretion system protein ImpA